MELGIDLQYLLFLQNLRLATGGIFDEFFNGMSKVAVDVLPFPPFFDLSLRRQEMGLSLSHADPLSHHEERPGIPAANGCLTHLKMGCCIAAAHFFCTSFYRIGILIFISDSGYAAHACT